MCCLLPIQGPLPAPDEEVGFADSANCLLSTVGRCEPSSQTDTSVNTITLTSLKLAPGARSPAHRASLQLTCPTSRPKLLHCHPVQTSVSTITSRLANTTLKWRPPLIGARSAEYYPSALAPHQDECLLCHRRMESARHHRSHCLQQDHRISRSPRPRQIATWRLERYL